jgi:uncharacterized membrane protein YbaN (DUF454 family)
MMNNELWFTKTVQSILKASQLSDRGKLAAIKQMLVSYEAMVEMDKEEE